jgi:RNA polymerase sigma-70 factor, ECF subfamily
MDSQAGEITGLLAEMRGGNREAEARLIPLVYKELRRLADYYMRLERPDHTLQATALVHEAYIRLLETREVDWQNRAHFFAVAAQLMRRILVDHARGVRAEKRQGTRKRVQLESALVYCDEHSDELIDLDRALTQLAVWDPRQCRIVEMRFFGGLSVEETAEVLGISSRTVKRDWNVARAWLYSQLSKGKPDDAGAMGTHQGSV